MCYISCGDKMNEEIYLGNIYGKLIEDVKYIKLRVFVVQAVSVDELK